jgi:large subunit ribosomal protein L18
MKVVQKTKRERIRTKIRSRVSGTEEAPRISVFRSNKFVLAQAIDDAKSVTMCFSTDQKLKTKENKISRSSFVGKQLAEKLIKMGVKKAVFDRGGYRYHGRVKAVAEGARESGLIF